MILDLWLGVDLILAGLLVGLAWAAVSSADLRRGVVLFIALGILLALIWARLNAPDLALAEAAIGAGLTGALLLAALRDPKPIELTLKPAAGPLVLSVSVLMVMLGAVYAWSLVHAMTAGDPVRLADQVASSLPQSGVSNPVTAVLLNFRAYDTLLELAVLLAAVLGIGAIGSPRPHYEPAGPVLRGLVGWVVPLLVLTGGYLLWVGAHAPGGAFQAGASLAAAAVLLRLAGHDTTRMLGPATQRWMLVAGGAVFLGVGLSVTVGGRAFMHYPAPWSGELILLIETAATLSIAAMLAIAYAGGAPATQDLPRPQAREQETP